jgi:glycosyltransferase involved in cell wall biosynthesis
VRVSIIVPAFNEERLLARSLAAIRRAATALDECGWELEWIVCDNNSTDRTAEIAREAGARVVFEPVNQIARARNAGAAVAGGEWLVFVDADSYPDRELFAEMAERMAAGRVLAGGAVIRMDVAALSARVAERLWNAISRLGRWPAGSFFFVEAAAFREVGGFGEDWFAGEELDLARKLKRLARRSGRRLVILHAHPLATSGRKVTLYSPLEFCRYLLRLVFTGGKSLRRRESAELWYDGRR